MKFREFVGEKKTQKPKIGTTQNTKINTTQITKPDEYYLGFSISKKTLKRTFDYIKSWFLRYHIPFKPINPYLTLYLLKNIPENKGKLIRSIKESKNDFIFSPLDEGSITLITGKTDIMQLEYSHNNLFMEVLENIFEDKDIDIIREFCYIKIFRLEKKIDESFLDEMMYSCPVFPQIKLGNVGLLKRRIR